MILKKKKCIFFKKRLIYPKDLSGIMLIASTFYFQYLPIFFRNSISKTPSSDVIEKERTKKRLFFFNFKEVV